MNEWMNERKNEWVNGWMNERLNEWVKDRWKARWNDAAKCGSYWCRLDLNEVITNKLDFQGPQQVEIRNLKIKIKYRNNLKQHNKTKQNLKMKLIKRKYIKINKFE